MLRPVLPTTISNSVLSMTCCFVVSCNSTYTLEMSASAASTSGPTGLTIPVQIRTPGAGNIGVALSSLPALISVSPSTVTTNNSGTATAYVLVPYGTEALVVGSAPLATGSVTVSAAPLTLCPPLLQAADSGGDIGPTGQIYAVSVQAMTAGSCPGGTPAPAGVGITITSIQPSGASGGSVSGTSTGAGSGTSSTSVGSVLTNSQGLATTNLQIPWGPDVLVQATGGGGLSSTLIQGVANPVTISCLYWTLQQPGVYRLHAQVVDDNQPVAASTVTFSVVSPVTNVGSVIPSSATTNEVGVVETFVTVGNATNLPVIVQAAVGSSSMAAEITDAGTGDAGACN